MSITPINLQLPLETYRIPREKPIPKPKPPTKWEKFAKLKVKLFGLTMMRHTWQGIAAKDNSRMVWDEETKVGRHCMHADDVLTAIRNK